MNKLILFLIFLSSNTLFASRHIDEHVAVLIARAYVTGMSYPVDGLIEEEVINPEKIDKIGYSFLVLDASGDCALTVFIKYDGSVDKSMSQQSCN